MASQRCTLTEGKIPSSGNFFLNKMTSKEKQKRQGKAPIVQPSPDSDLVKLTKEFESLKSKIKEQNNVLDELYSTDRARKVDFDIANEVSDKQAYHIIRQMRITKVQLTNVCELMKQAAGGGCIEA